MLNHCRFVCRSEKENALDRVRRSFVYQDASPGSHKDKSREEEKTTEREKKGKDKRYENESGRSFSDPDFRFAIITTR